jgi:hypothetical protein
MDRHATKERLYGKPPLLLLLGAIAFLKRQRGISGGLR